MSHTTQLPMPQCRPAESGSAARRYLALAIIASGMFMGVLDTTIVNVALPAIRASFGAQVSALAWIVDAYTLSFAALIMMGGTASDRLGARTVYMAGLGLFVAASAACGLAPDLGSLVVARFAQGLGAALFLPASLALVRQAFENPHERARAIATWATIASVAAALGPLAGGVLVDTLGWRSAFLVNLPIGLAGLALTWLFVTGRGCNASRSFDGAGQLASIVALGALCCVAIELPGRGMGAAEVWVPALVALGAGAAFIAIERRARQPMVPLAWFRNPVFASMTSVGALVYLGYFGLLFILSIYLQGERHLSAHAAGFALLPMAVSLAVGNMLSQRLVGRFVPERLVAVGLALAAVSVPLAALALTRGLPMPLAHAALVLFGLGTSVTVAPMISTVLEQVPSEQAGIASGLLNAMRQTGSLMGVALASAAVVLAHEAHTALWIVAAISGAAYAGAALLSYRCAKSQSPSPSPSRTAR